MGFFNWSAPIIHRFGQRWTAEDIAEMVAWLSPFLTRPGSAVLDVGGGSGGLASRLADDLARTVTVLDPTPQLLARLPGRPDVVGVLGVAERMPFADGSFDAAVVTDAFHHFRDQEGAAREIRRVLRPGGAVLLHELDPHGWMRALVWGEKLLGEPGAFLDQDEMCRFMRAHGIEGTCAPRRGHEYRFTGTRLEEESRGQPPVPGTAPGTGSKTP